MKSEKFSVVEIPATRGFEENTRIIWEGEDRSEAWHEFAGVIWHAGLNLKDEDTVFIYQLVECEINGILFIRASMVADARPFSIGFDDKPDKFGNIPRLPKTSQQDAIEFMKNVLMAFVEDFKLSAHVTPGIPGQYYNWRQWFAKIYLTRQNIFP